MRLIAACLICICTTIGHADERILVVSGNAQRVTPQNVVIWEVTAKPTGTLIKLGEISAEGGVGLISGFPEERLLVIWGYTPRGASVERQGYLKVCNLNHPDDSLRVALPFEPSLGGYLLKDSRTGGLSVATLGLGAYKGKAIMCQLSDGRCTTQPEAELECDAIRMCGTNHQRGYDKPLLGKLRIDGSFQYDIETSQGHSALRVSDGLLDARTMDLGWCGIVARNARVTVVTVGSKPEAENRRYWFVYDKQTAKWEKLAGFGFRTEAQVLGEWLVLQEATCDYAAKSDTTEITGKIVLYHTLRRSRVVAELGKTVEVLLVRDDTVYYRLGRDLFRAKTASGLGGAELMLSSQVLEDVHWAFVAESKPGQDREEKRPAIPEP